MNGNYRTLTALAEELEFQEKRKQDFIVNSAFLQMADTNTLTMEVNNTPTFYHITDHCHGQVADKLNIPRKYYDTIAKVPGLREQNVNAWLHYNAKNQMIRTLDNNVRAFVSDKFKPFDNILVLGALLPAIQKIGMQDLAVKALALSEKKMYIQLVFPKIQGEVKPGDIVQSGITITNSEVGAGAVDIKHMVWRLVCSNGLIGKSCLRKNHIGSRFSGNEEDYSIYTNETITSELNTLKLKMTDVMTDMLKPESFQKQLLLIQNAANTEIKDVVKTVENVTKKYTLTESEGRLIVSTMAREGNSNKWGVVNGITALAHNIENIDRQYEYEKLGNSILNTTDIQWQELAA